MQHSHAAHAEDPFLPQPQLGPAGVEPMAEPAVRWIILLEVGVQKKDRDAAHHHTPGADAHVAPGHSDCGEARIATVRMSGRDRKSTRLNSSHDQISYAVFCLKKKRSSGPAAHC